MLEKPCAKAINFLPFRDHAITSHLAATELQYLCCKIGNSTALQRRFFVGQMEMIDINLICLIINGQLIKITYILRDSYRLQT